MNQSTENPYDFHSEYYRIWDEGFTSGQEGKARTSNPYSQVEDLAAKYRVWYYGWSVGYQLRKT